MTSRLASLLAVALVALVVSTAASSASPSPISTALVVNFERGGHATPPATHGISTAVISQKPLHSASPPSDHDRLVALIRRVNELQDTLAQAKHTATLALNRAENANAILDCITGGRSLVENAQGAILSNDAATPDDQDAFVVATFEASCLVPA